MLKLVDIFGYLAVILSAATLVGQSLLLGGLLFLFWIARPGPEIPAEGMDRVRSLALKAFRIAALGLALVQLLYLYVNASVLMASAEISFREAAGANFFISGSVMLVAALLIAMLARNQKPVDAMVFECCWS